MSVLISYAFRIAVWMLRVEGASRFNEQVLPSPALG
jgi:hypothetical protein